MITCSSLLGLVRCRGFSDPQKRPAFNSVRSLKRSTFPSFSSSRSSPLPSSPASAAAPGWPLPARPLDVVIHNLNADAWGTARAARPISVETLLAHMLAVVARRHIHLHSVAATAFSITLVIDDSLEMMSAATTEDAGNVSCDAAAAQDVAQSAQNAHSTPSEKSGSTEKSNQGFRLLVAELVNTVDGVDLREKDFICEENRRSRILGQRRHDW